MKTNKIGFCFLLFFLFLSVLSLPVYASQQLVVDDAGLFTESQKEQLENEAQRISETYNTNVFVLTTNQSGTSRNYAQDIAQSYGEANFPEGYIGFVIDMKDRSYYVDAYGTKQRELFTQSKVDDLADRAYSHLADGEYFEAAQAVLKEIENQYSISSSPWGWLKKLYLYPEMTLFFLGVSLMVSLIGAWILTVYKTSFHKDKGIALNAQPYAGAFSLGHHRDIYIRSYQTRVPRPKPQHVSSGGGGGGGGGGHTGSGGHF